MGTKVCAHFRQYIYKVKSVKVKRNMKSRLERYLRYLREGSELQIKMLAQKLELKEQEVKQMGTQNPVLVEQDVRQVVNPKPGLMKQQVKQVVNQKPLVMEEATRWSPEACGGGEGKEAGHL